MSDPLAPIEVLLDGLGLGDSRYATIRNLDRDFRDALAEARHNVARLTRLEAESDRLREALARVEALAKIQATSLQAAHRADMERNWLDVLAIIERTALAQPSTDEEADQ